MLTISTVSAPSLRNPCAASAGTTDDLAAASRQLAVLAGERHLAAVDHEHLGIRVPIQGGLMAGRHMVDEEGDADAEVAPEEPLGGGTERQLVGGCEFQGVHRAILDI